MNTGVQDKIISLEREGKLNEQTISDICASFQSALSVHLENRLERSIIYYNTILRDQRADNEENRPIDIVSTDSLLETFLFLF